MNTFLSLADILETLLQDVLLCYLIIVLASSKNIGSVLEGTQTQNVPLSCFAGNLIKTPYVPVVIYIS